MTPTTLIRTISAVQDERIVLSGLPFCRPHGIAAWQKLRIAMRWSMTDTGATIAGSPIFAVGLCSGDTNIFGDATTDHFVGVKTTGATWPRTTPGPPSCYQVYPTQSGKLVGVTWTLATNWLSSAGQAMSDAPNGNRFCWFIDITKGDPTYTIGGYANVTGNAGDISEATFLTQSNNVVAVMPEHALGNSGTVAVDEDADGVLDHVCVHWNKATPEIEISNLKVRWLA